MTLLLVTGFNDLSNQNGSRFGPESLGWTTVAHGDGLEKVPPDFNFQLPRIFSQSASSFISNIIITLFVMQVQANLREDAKI